MKTNIRPRRGFTLVELLVVIAIIATLAGIATPVYIGHIRDAECTKATINAKQIGIVLLNFEREYGSFPDDESEKNLDPEAVLSTAGGSNRYLSQLFAAGFIDQEKPFYCKTAFTREPDNKRASGKLLEAGEVGFSYVMRAPGEGLSNAVNSSLPLLISAASGNNDGKFDHTVYNSKAAVLAIDMSVTQPRVNDDGEIVLMKGERLMNTGADTPWNDSSISNPVVVDPATR